MIQALDITTAGYHAALNGPLADESGAGRVFMRGKDRVALLQRLSTNDIAQLRPGQGARTVLTTPIGRIIDVLNVHVLEDALLIVTSPGQGGPVWAYLKKNIFFNDQVSLEAAGRSHSQLALYGPAAVALLEQVSSAVLSELPPQHTATIDLAGVPVLLARREPIGARLYLPAIGVRVMRGPVARAADDVAALDAAGRAWLRRVRP